MEPMTELATKNDQAVLPFSSTALPEQWASEPVAAFAAWRRTMKAANGYAYDPRSIKQHVAMWATLVAYCQSHGATILTLSPTLLEAFFAQLRGRPVKTGQASLRFEEGEIPEATASTRRRYAQLLERTFEHLVKSGIRRGNPIAPLMQRLNKPEAPGFVSYLSKAEEDAFLAWVQAMEETHWQDQRNKTLLLLLSASGITEGELVALRIADVSLEDFKPTLQVGERGLKHAHATTINNFALPVLRRWMNAIAGVATDAPLFPSLAGSVSPMLARDVYLTTRAALEASGFKGKQRGPQTLRNSFLRRQIYFGLDGATINGCAGLHSDRTLRKLRRTLPNTAGVRPA
jgi:integrase/recombinase XerD